MRRVIPRSVESRRLYAGMVAGLAGGVLTAAGARVSMRVVRVYIEHGVGEFTVEGTLGILFFLSLPAVAAGALYARVRDRLSGGAGTKGLVYGALLLLALGTLFFVTSEDEFGMFVPGRQLRFAMFGALFLVYGAVTGLVAPHADRLPAPSAWAFTLLGLAALAGAVIVAIGLVSFATQLAQRPEELPARLFVWAVGLALAVLLLAARTPRRHVP